MVGTFTPLFQCEGSSIIRAEEVLTCIAPALQELTSDRVMEVLPALQNIYIDGSDQEPEPVPEAVWKFVGQRRLYAFPVAIRRRHPKWAERTWVVIESRTR
jgi:hypothetical protein